MNNKEVIIVPSDVKFISDWEEFKNIDLSGQVIVNKKYTGCGMTSYYLWNDMPVIIAAPRKMLLENKMKQQETGRPTLFYYEVPKKCDSNVHQILHEKTKEYIYNQYCLKQPPKILVTYKSFTKACDVLRNLNIPFQVVVDEFHVITQDIEMNPEDTVSFLRYLKQLPNVIYLTATPESEQDLSSIKDFQGMRYVELEWANLKTATIRPIPMTNTIQACSDVIQSYRQKGYFERKGDMFSTEAVFYINDVANIMSIIKKNKLDPDETNILVSTSDSKNRIKLRKLCDETGKEFTMGNIPKKDERHKTFTFCSRVVFYGCDFYSSNAYTYVFADANRDNRRIDIALDLPQIMGRQRREDNKFRYEAILYVKTTCLKEMQSEEEFKAEHSRKIRDSERDSEAWNNLPPLSRINLAIEKPSNNYIVKYMDTDGQYKFECNDIRILSDIKAWREKNKYYKDSGTITMNLYESSFNVATQNSHSLLDFYNVFLQEGEWKERMKMYCEFLQTYPEYISTIRTLTWIPEEFHNFYETLGHERIKANGFQRSRLLHELAAVSCSDDEETMFLSEFKVGECIPKSKAKERIQKIYERLGLDKTAKATELRRYFRVEETNVRDDGKIQHGFRIIGLCND